MPSQEKDLASAVEDAATMAAAAPGVPRKSPRLLSVLPEQAPLRRTPFQPLSPFLTPLEGSPAETPPLPRALRSLAHIVDGGLCHRCGSCVGICPTKVLGRDADEYPRVDHLSACTDCDLCVRVCPGDEFDLNAFHQEIYGSPATITDTHGPFERGVLAASTDPFIREHSTSGGLVTALLAHLLESGEIDGAVCIGSDEAELWKGKAIVARSRQELLSSMKSKYAISPTNSVFGEIREIPGRYAIVGLPCQIHGFLKAAQLDPRIKSRVVLSIGLFCHAAIEHEAFHVMWETLGDKKAQVKRFISRVGKHPGTPYVELKDGSLYPFYFGNRSGYRPSSIEVINVLYRLFTPVRCTTCFDGLSDFADISVGDPWMAPPEDHVDLYQGWSFGLLRSARGVAAYEKLVKAGKVESVEVTRREVLESNKLMASEKRWRAFRVIETHRRQGKAIPNYGSDYSEFPRHHGLQFIKTELHMLSHIFCFLPKLRAKALRFFLTGGYWLFWLNHKRRALRVIIRDTKEKMRRKVMGRR
jgi:coenzyme F420 hydrogenase subunit beta